MEQHEAATILIETITRMASEGRPLMARVLPPGEVHFWDHFPEEDARDAQSLSRWYYHVHAPVDRDSAEHGHFHLFLHRSQIDPGAAPLAGPEEGEDAPAQVVHIAGLSIDHAGLPIGWFATNRWITDEFLYPAETVIAHLDRYNVDHTAEDGLVNRLLTAMVALYRDELTELLRERDKQLVRLVRQRGKEAYEAGHDILASAPIDLDAKVEAISKP